MSSYGSLPIETLMGLTFIKIDFVRSHRSEDAIVFHTNDGRTFKMSHLQDCCENVNLDDVAGDPDDLLNSPIVRAEEPSSLDNFDTKKPLENTTPESFTWTFYILGTQKGTVTLRWYGTSSGYYAESVKLEELSS